MEAFVNDLYGALEIKLQNLRNGETNRIKFHQLAVEACLEYIARLKSKFQTFKPETVEEEISFFKRDKPKLLSLLIFHINAYNIELSKPAGDVFAQVKYLEGQCGRLEQYFSENKELVKYYHSESTFLDREIFVRNQKNLALFIEPFVFQFDENFNTTHDYKLSTIIAYEKLEIYLVAEITRLKSSPSPVAEYGKQHKLNWTGSKVSLVELVYALFCSGCINHGNTEIAELAAFFEKNFDIDLGDYYRKYLEIKDRKQNPTKFLDSLKNSLQKKMEEEL